MTTTTPALIADSASSGFRHGTIEQRDLRPDDVRIDVAYAGICHSDIHTVREEWGTAHFPLVTGHEIAGTVAAVGDAVTKYKVGDRVGVGCLVDSCGECEMCRDDHENFCTKGSVGTYNDQGYDGEWTTGGYAQQVVASERFVLGIPEGIELSQAAPLLCAGITTYTPLVRWGAGPGKKVAVVGMGGLGHMGVKIAVALGAEVTVLSQTLSKEEDGRAFGATDYRATSDEQTFKDLRGQFDLILCTVSADLPVDKYLRLLKTFGTFVMVGLPENPQALHFGSLIMGDKVMTGSNIGGIKGTQEMLDFCAEHGIGATVEVISADEVGDAYDKVVGSKVRYRYVIDTSTITPAA
ncbi:NAD(P)-dependent alcohol dehydrogenase [Phycicoccus duodecadis]|uniref:alcohol dehydrogenase (NADP(+)) n=1 Tax=Phycicoccus duodecadis TaxID=173053 RepID=A0A2N3YGZ5_9MICO|nr:NAD(P)-dependent alcohol dehydrogenase [Phycicoccus duodecadis]PKW26132.1 putative zinc-type alcohol dehydrogenase-like protein [Phycicoccus duodecadis]